VLKVENGDDLTSGAKVDQPDCGSAPLVNNADAQSKPLLQ